MIILRHMNPLYLVGQDCPLTKLPSTFPTKIDDDLSLGLDLGIGSCGQALIWSGKSEKPTIRNLPAFPSQIAFLGVRAFNIPETKEKTGPKLKNPERRKKRLMRRAIRRKSHRIERTRNLLKEFSLLPEGYDISLKQWQDWHSQMTEGNEGQAGPWHWRVQALDKKIPAEQLAAILIHFAKHRGFKSNRKSDLADKNSKEGGTLDSANANRKALTGYRSVAEMFLNDKRFEKRKHNREGDYCSMVYRADNETEIRLIFEAQRGLGNAHASVELEEKFLRIFNSQRLLQNPVTLLGQCPFEPSNDRCSRNAYSFELSRALQKLNTVFLSLESGEKVKLSEYIDAASGGYDGFIDQFGLNKKISWHALRNFFNIPKRAQFIDLRTPRTKVGEAEKYDNPESDDFATRSTSSSAASGSYTLRKVIGTELWNQLVLEDPRSLDEAAFCLSFFEPIENGENEIEHMGIIDAMKIRGVDSQLIDAIRKDLTGNTPTLHNFSGATSLSSLACRKLISELRKGFVYSDACDNVGYNHTTSDFALGNITNPVVQSVVREVMKQVIHLIDQTGKIPGRICVELARDLGKSIEERGEIKLGINTRTKNKNANRDNLREHLKLAKGSKIPTEDLLRYELLLEQSATCPYCGEHLCKPKDIRSTDFQVDHILPRSRSHDNSYDNKVLVHTGCNQNKGNSTPFESSNIGNNNERSKTWLKHFVLIQGMKGLRKRKRRNLLDTTFAERESEFTERNLNDTRYISKIVLAYLNDIYRIAGENPESKGATKRVFARPGQLTSLTRRSWGLENLKKDRDGLRLGDKHHAVDALLCACLSEGQLKWLTKAYQQMGKMGDNSLTPIGFRKPWKTLREDVVKALELITVSRRENRKGRGSLHNDTLYRVETDDEGNDVSYLRRTLVSKDGARLKPYFEKLSDVNKIKDINNPRNEWLKRAIKKWIKDGSPVDQPPLDPQGCQIRKVTCCEGRKSTRKYPQGYVTSGDQVRLDIFSTTNKNGSKSYAQVPVYSYHLINDQAPSRIIVANKNESDWPKLTDGHKFEFSLWSNSRFEIKKKATTKKPEGEHLVGLYKGVNRNTGAIAYSHPDDSEEQSTMSVKVGTLLFRKIETDRLGREFPVKSEKRTWRGQTIA